MKCLLQGTVNLPGSKSESNRALMIAAYGGFPLQVENLSEAHDTVLLKSLLEQTSSVVDCKDAGTVARFLLTYLANKPGNWILTGTQRLCERPMAPLVDALRQLGADITGDGLPLKIIGHPITGGSVTLDASQSSQFASSLLLAAPMWERGLQLTLTGNPVSMPYLEMTIKMMEHYGVQVGRKDNTFFVAHQPYQDILFTVSPDWSAASYWYELMAVCDGGSLILNGLRNNTLQGDAVVADWFSALGVATSFEEQGARLTKNAGACAPNVQPLTFDFKDTPDLFPSVFVTCVMLHYQARFQRIANLSLKESNRVDSLVSELLKFYTFINKLIGDEIVIDKSFFKENIINNNKVIINTYQDHRIAMALAPLFLRGNQVVFDDFSVVTKSYPSFWDNIKKNCVFYNI